MKALIISSLATALVGLAVGATLAVARIGTWSDARLWGDSSATDERAKPRASPLVEIDETEFHFGTMERGVTRAHTFVIRNRGTAPLRLSVGQTTCKCTIGQISQEAVPPGNAADVRLEWSATTGDGPFRQTATIITNDPARPRVELVVVGDVTASTRVTPAEFHFGKVSLGDARQASVTLLSFHAASLELLGYEFADPEVEQTFLVRHEPVATDDLPDERAQAGVRITVTVPSSLPIGHFHHRLTLYTNLPDAEKIELPVMGRVVGAVSIFGRNWDDDRGALRLGTVKSEWGAISKLILAVRGQHAADVQVSLLRADPPSLRVSVGQRQQISETMSHVPLTIEVPPGTRPMIRLSTEQGKAGRIALGTSHPDAPSLDLEVIFAVEP